ncbi:MAG TPA: poly-gamma-glutamate hydrolase family protein [Acidimicrobiia bacterium]
MLADLLRHPGVVEEVELRSRVGFLALHGGSLERGTAEIARAAADAAGASCYTIRQPEDLRWHVPSSRCDPAESSALHAFLEHVDAVVSIHGFGRKHLGRAVLVGGANRGLAARTAATLRASLPGYRIVDRLDDIPVALRGLHPANPVNRPRNGGIQLELPPRVRDHALSTGDRAALISALASLA